MTRANILAAGEGSIVWTGGSLPVGGGEGNWNNPNPQFQSRLSSNVNGGGGAGIHLQGSNCQHNPYHLRRESSEAPRGGAEEWSIHLKVSQSIPKHPKASQSIPKYPKVSQSILKGSFRVKQLSWEGSWPIFSNPKVGRCSGILAGAAHRFSKILTDSRMLQGRKGQWGAAITKIGAGRVGRVKAGR